MRTMTVKLEDDFARDVETFRREANYPSTSALVRDALRLLIVEHRRQALQSRLRRYLQETAALQQAADEVEGRMPITTEALCRSEVRDANSAG